MSRFQFCLLAAVVSIGMSGCCWGGWGRNSCGGGCGSAYGYQGYGQTAFAAPAYGAPGSCGCQ